MPDIGASSFRRSVMECQGFGYDRLKKINPRIIWAVASDYRLAGQYDKRIAQDLLAQAMGGLMSITGKAGRPPTATGTWIADCLGAMPFARGMMAALAAREKTGSGQMTASGKDVGNNSYKVTFLRSKIRTISGVHLG